MRGFLHILIIFSAFLHLSPARAAIPPSSNWTAAGLSEVFSSQKETEIPFYKSKNSAFPSGYTTLERLKEKILQADSNEEYVFSKNKKQILVPAHAYVTVFHLSRVWVEKYSRKKVEPDLSKSLEDILLNYETDPFDRGLIQVLNSTWLKSAPNYKGKNLLRLDEETKLIPISFEKGFVKVMAKNKFGYVDISDCISKFDFAKFAIPFKSQKKSWEIIKRRDFDNLITADDGSIPLTQVSAFLTNEKIAFVTQNLAQITKWTQLEITKQTTDPWIKSELKGHGSIWWKKIKLHETTKTALTIDDLLKREIFSASFDPKNPKKGLISSHGVYISKDGENWTEIPQFKTYSGPVYYLNENTFFIGNFKTLNAGKTFENYIQIDKLSEAIQNFTGTAPRKIKITNVKLQKPLSIVVEVYTGSSSVKLKSPLFAQDWKPIR